SPVGERHQRCLLPREQRQSRGSKGPSRVSPKGRTRKDRRAPWRAFEPSPQQDGSRTLALVAARAATASWRAEPEGPYHCDAKVSCATEHRQLAYERTRSVRTSATKFHSEEYAPWAIRAGSLVGFETSIRFSPTTRGPGPDIC